MNFLAGARRRRNGETTVFGCFLKFEVAGSRQAFRAACFRFYQPAAAFRFRPKRPLQSEHFWDFWAFLQIGQLRCNKPPKPHPERYAPSYPGTAGRAEIRPAPEPGMGARCAKTQYVKLGFCFRKISSLAPPEEIPPPEKIAGSLREPESGELAL